MTAATPDRVSAQRAPRMPGIDVARALAVLGMVLLNVRAKVDAEGSDFEWLVWASSRFEGKPAALFVVLAGVGIALHARGARATGGLALQHERLALLQRGALLFALGIVHLQVWSWDILHFYGAAMALAAVALSASNRALWLGALCIGVTAVALQMQWDWWQPIDRWTWPGMGQKLVFNGNYAVFPWMSFVLIGMWLGRQDLTDPAVRRPIFIAAVAVFVLAQALDALVRTDASGAAVLQGEWTGWARVWPRPARPGFVVAGAAGAIATICGCIALTERRARARWVVALGATGQLAFTLYLLQTILLLVLLRLQWMVGTTLEQACAVGLLCFGGMVVASAWWRRRWARGPLEWCIRRFPAPRDPLPGSKRYADGAPFR